MNQPLLKPNPLANSITQSLTGKKVFEVPKEKPQIKVSKKPKTKITPESIRKNNRIVKNFLKPFNGNKNKIKEFQQRLIKSHLYTKADVKRFDPKFYKVLKIANDFYSKLDANTMKGSQEFIYETFATASDIERLSSLLFCSNKELFTSCSNSAINFSTIALERAELMNSSKKITEQHLYLGDIYDCKVALMGKEDALYEMAKATRHYLTTYENLDNLDVQERIRNNLFNNYFQDQEYKDEFDKDKIKITLNQELALAGQGIQIKKINKNKLEFLLF